MASVDSEELRLALFLVSVQFAQNKNRTIKQDIRSTPALSEMFSREPIRAF